MACFNHFVFYPYLGCCCPPRSAPVFSCSTSGNVARTRTGGSRSARKVTMTMGAYTHRWQVNCFSERRTTKRTPKTNTSQQPAQRTKQNEKSTTKLLITNKTRKETKHAKHAWDVHPRRRKKKRLWTWWTQDNTWQVPLVYKRNGVTRAWVLPWTRG